MVPRRKNWGVVWFQAYRKLGAVWFQGEKTGGAGWFQAYKNWGPYGSKHIGKKISMDKNLILKFFFVFQEILGLHKTILVFLSDGQTLIFMSIENLL